METHAAIGPQRVLAQAVDREHLLAKNVTPDSPLRCVDWFAQFSFSSGQHPFARLYLEAVSDSNVSSMLSSHVESARCWTAPLRALTLRNRG